MNMKTKIHARVSFGPDFQQTKFRNSLKWSRDVVRMLHSTKKSRHNADGDLIHIYAHTKCFLRLRKYKKSSTPTIHITPRDLSPKYAEKLGSGVHEYHKTYSESYCIGQLMVWYIQYPDPDVLLAESSRGCLSLPKAQKASQQLVYGRRTVKFMLSMMKKKTPNALARGPDMVIQELPEHCWQPNAGHCPTQGAFKNRCFAG
ncbi:histone-lysine N-methyltransferase ATXR3-like [Andrographis paniculata]|uniref:histone-lysine N-methyltransferase ATXR3-like n=1 Tax=Andrographis paniculata TaxID=175694 RepID=UPI0021E7E39A|nr:histone-lysine N-methyltransferase ATXR3-like [Andrographis paniculata]